MDLGPAVSTSSTRRPRRRLAVRVCSGAIVLAALMVLVVSLALAVSPSFPDVPAGHTYYAAITDLASRSIINGYGNGNFGPGDPVLRQQFAKMIVLTGDYLVSEADICTFTDVEKSDATSFYPDNFVAVAAAHQITKGTSPGLFSPGAHISRLQVISMVVRAADDLEPGLLMAPPAAWTSAAGWGDAPTHGANARRAEYNNLLAGLPLAALDPWGDMSRGEVAQVLHNLLGELTPPVTTTTQATTTTTQVTTTTTSSSTTTTSSSTTTTTAPAVYYEKLGGVLASGPAVASWSSGRLDVFARGTDNALWHKWYSGGWSGWQNLGGAFKNDPAAVSWGPNRIDVFVRGMDDRLYHKWWNGSAWLGWENLGGVITSGPAVISLASGHLDVYVRGPAPGYHLLHRFYNAGWSGWEDLGGVITSDPAAVSWASNRIDVFARGTDSAIWHKYWNGSTWSSYGSLGGTFTSGPAVASWANGRLDVFARGTDNTLWHRYFEGGWSTWTSHGGPAIGSDPDAVSWGPNRIDVFVRGTDSALWHTWWNGSEWLP